MFNIVATFMGSSQILSFVFIFVGNPTLLSVVGNYILIHLREAAEQLSDGELRSCSELRTSSSIKFVQFSDLGTTGESEVE